MPFWSAQEASIAREVVQQMVGGFVQRGFHAACAKGVAALQQRLTTAQSLQAVDFQDFDLYLIEQLRIDANRFLNIK